jgi:hypothetical protein
MMKRTIAVAAVLTATFAVSGCWESGDITIHEAGKYKGVRDPLLKQDVAERADTLEKRFALIQMDR